MKTMITGVCASFALTAFASAQEADGKTFGDGELPDFLVPFDIDEDGELSLEERQAAREARREAKQERRANIIEQFDADGDGELNAEEREAARAAARARIEAKRIERFEAVDTDDSGSLDSDEFAAIPAITKLAERRPEAVDRLFGRMDADESGEISQEEFLARAGKRHRSHRSRPTPGE